MVNTMFADDRYLERMQDFTGSNKKALIYDLPSIWIAKRWNFWTLHIAWVQPMRLRKADVRSSRIGALHATRCAGGYWIFYPNGALFQSEPIEIHYHGCSVKFTVIPIAAIITSGDISRITERFGWSAGTGL